jgi:hypothetical protein
VGDDRAGLAGLYGVRLDDGERAIRSHVPLLERA